MKKSRISINISGRDICLNIEEAQEYITITTAYLNHNIRRFQPKLEPSNNTD